MVKRNLALAMQDCAHQYEKSDLERVGLFIEMPFIGIKRIKGRRAIVNEPRNLLAGFPKSKCGNQDGYFEEDYKRGFNKEKPVRILRKKGGKPEKLPFIPAGPTKKQTGAGDYFGCFTEPIEEWSPRTRPKPKREKLKPNIITNPAKKGGPGYVGITLGEYPEHSEEPYEHRPKRKKDKPGKKKKPGKPPIYAGRHPQPYFHKNPYVDEQHDPPTKPLYIIPKPPKRNPKEKKLVLRPIFIPTGPTKSLGGCKAGCFEKWPRHEKEPYMSPEKLEKYVKPPRRGKLVEVVYPYKDPFASQSRAIKSMQTPSVLEHTSYSVNKETWKTYTPKYVKYLL